MTARIYRWPSRAWAIWQSAARNDAGIASAAIAFFAILGPVPALGAIGLVCGWMSSPIEVLKAFALFCRLLPPEAAQFVLKQLALTLVGGARAGGVALITTLALGLYGLMNASQALIDGLNLAYRLPERRSWLRRMAVAAAIAGAGAVTVVAMIAALLIAGRLGVGRIGVHRAAVGATLLGTMGLGIALLAMVYRYAPSRQHGNPHRVLPGAAAATILSTASSAVFALYAAHLGNFTATYGLLAGVAPLMLWLQLCGYAVLLGAAVNSAKPGTG